ncbi:Tn3 family transposase [Patescibacteria group bacterium]|nr:Tn3 family transposase [Patescibacteria group bacterium]
MSHRFLKADNREAFNNFPSSIDENDLIAHFLLTPDDLALVRSNRTQTQRLGFALLLCSLRYLGFFPQNLLTAPDNMIHYLAEQTDCDVEAIMSYGQRSDTRQEHQRIIMAYLDFRWFKPSEEQTLFEWLSQRALENDRPSTLFQQASEWLYKQRIVRPGITTLEELVLTSRDKAHELTYKQVSQALDETLIAELDKLLEPNLELGSTPLSWLRRPARGYGANDIVKVLDKLGVVYEWSIDDWQLTNLPPGRSHHLVQIACRSSNQALQLKEGQQKYPLLMAFMADARERLTDEVLDLYDQRLMQTERSARQDLQAHRLKISQALQKVAWYFGKTTPIILNEAEVADSDVRATIFKTVSRVELEDSLRLLTEHQHELDVIHFIGRRYSYLRQFFPRLISTLKFRAYQEPDLLLEALHILQEMDATSSDRLPTYLEDVPTDFIDKDWLKRTVNHDGTVNRRWYDLCVMWELRNALRSGRIWVEHSKRYTHLDTYLMPQEVWQTKKSVFFELVAIEPEWDHRRKILQTQLKIAFQDLNDQLPDDEALRIENGRIILTPYEGKDEPSPLALQIQDLLPHLQLPELLHEVDTWTNFSRHLYHAGNANSRIDQLLLHLYAVMLAQARNIDFKQMVDVVDLSYRQLLWCNNWYVREETLQRATDELVNYQYRQPLSHYWGDGRFSSSDGQRFPVAVRTQNATPLPRYFGYGRGLTFLTWTSNQYSQYGTLVTPPTHREAAYTLDKILDNDSDLEVKEHTTDTNGYTDLIFALFDLLGMQFAPRLKDISATRLFRMDLDITYDNLKALTFHKSDLDLITRNWDEMLRLVASLKFRWTTPSLIIRKLQSFPRQHILTQALQEYGRIIKTTFILRYYISETYRRRIDAQLNKSENFHALRGHIHSANRGKIRKPYPEQHLNQANCLNLIVNAVAVWNTVYMQSAIQHLQSTGQDIAEADLEQLSPVRYEHINVFGKYSFDSPAALTDEGLRPLVVKE